MTTPIYKKTTTIVEEHGTPSAISSTDAFKLRLNVRDKLAQYTSDMRNYITSKVNKTGDNTHIADSMRVDMSNLTETIQPYFADDKLLELSSALHDVTIGITKTIDTMVENKDPTVSIRDAKLLIEQLAKSLDKLDLVMTNRTINAWFAFLTSAQRQTSARQQKDWKNEQDAYNTAYNILVNGQQTNITSFADMLTDGVLNIK